MNAPAETMEDYGHASERLKALEANWEIELAETRRRRRIRFENVSIEALRASGKLKGDETYICRRIADSNIRRELAPMIAYIVQSRDVAKFRPLTPLELPVETLEREFSTVAQHDRWERPFFKTAEGTATHGWAAVETLFDESKPGHFLNRYIAHEDLLFANDVCELQQSPLVVVVYGATTTELAEWVEDYDFSAEQVEEVLEHAKARENKSETKVRLLKVYFKKEDDFTDGKPTVWVGWACLEGAKDWLRTPERLTLGRATKQEVIHETEYPIEVWPYTVSEEDVLMSTKGRVFFDEHDQEACTTLVTAFVNRARRSAYILVARDGEDGDDGPASKQTEVVLGDGKILPKVKFFNIEPPDAALLNGMFAITSQNANENGQVNFAVQNRKDSRKTATEVQAATQQGALLNSVQVALLSTFLRNVWTRCWNIYQSQVLQQKIKSNLDERYFTTNYVLVAAGDTDVIRRQEILQRMKQDWPVMQTTGARDVFLLDLIRASYPDQAARYEAAIVQGNEKDQLLVGMRNALMALAVDPATQQIKPDVLKYLPQLQELQGAYQKVMTPPGAAQPGIQDNAPESGGEQYAA